MAFIGNVLWFILGGGIIACIAWFLLGLVLCLTIVGIPFGVASLRIAGFAAFPFGQELVDARLVGEERIPGTALANLLWVILAGIWLTISHVVAGIAYCITIIGIPFGLAHLKLAAVSFAPLGKRAVSTELAQAARARASNVELDRRLGQ